MRNWPVKYQELRERNDPDAVSHRLIASSLSPGILGGASLAIVATSPYRREATEVIAFLTGSDAQRRIADAGFGPTRTDAYTESTLQGDVPGLRDAVETSLPRPIHPNYLRFSEVTYAHIGAMLAGDTPLTQQFIDDMRAVLSGAGNG